MAIGAEGEELVANSALISVLTVVGLATGFVETAVVAMLFGISRQADAFYVALTVPAIMGSLLTLCSNSALVPAFARRAEQAGEAGAWALFNVVFTVLAGLLSGLALLGTAGSPLLIRLMAPGLDPATRDTAAALSRLLFGVIIFYGATATIRAFLYARRVYGAPTLLIAVSDVVAIAVTIAGAGRFGIQAAAYGIIGGAAVQSAAAVALLARGAGARYRPSLDLSTPGLREALGMFGSVLFGAGSRRAVTVVERFLASFLPPGTIAALSIGNKLNMMVGGVFFSSLTTAILPGLSASMVRQHVRKVQEALLAGLKLITIISVPVTVGLLLLRFPLVALLFQRGAVTPAQTSLVAAILGFYLLSIPFMGYFRLVQNFFYSAISGRAASSLFLLAAVSNLLLDLILVRLMGAYGIALAWTLSLVVVSTTSFIMLHVRVPGMPWEAVASYVLRVGVVTLGLAGGMVGAWLSLAPLLLRGGDWARLAAVLITGGAGAAAFLLAASVLRIEELAVLWGLARRRVGRLLRPLSSPAS